MLLFQLYIWKVLKQVHPELQCTNKAMVPLNKYLDAVYKQICDKALELCKESGRQTLTDDDIHEATALVLSGELASYAQAEGRKAVARYKKNSKM